MSLIAQLDSYPLNTQVMTFSVTINPCVVTSAAVTTNALDPLKTQLVYVRDSVGAQITLATFT